MFLTADSELQDQECVCVCVCVCVYTHLRPNLLSLSISAELLKDREGILVKVLHERWPSSVGPLVQREKL